MAISGAAVAAAGIATWFGWRHRKRYGAEQAAPPESGGSEADGSRQPEQGQASADEAATPKPALHFVDLENLCKASTSDAFTCFAEYCRMLYKAGDRVIVASNESIKEAVEPMIRDLYDLWPVSNSSPDSADNLLVLQARAEAMGDFSEVVIGSGDGGLTAIAEEAAEHGLPVTVAGIAGSISRHYDLYENVNIRNLFDGRRL